MVNLAVYGVKVNAKIARKTLLPNYKFERYNKYCDPLMINHDIVLPYDLELLAHFDADSKNVFICTAVIDLGYRDQLFTDILEKCNKVTEEGKQKWNALPKGLFHDLEPQLYVLFWDFAC